MISIQVYIKKWTSLQIKSSVLFLYKEDEMTEAILVNY